MAYTIIMLINSMVSISMGLSRIITVDQSQSKDSVIHCGCTCMATIYVRVVDRDGREVSGLRKNDFTVYEDGVIQTIDAFIENAGQDKTMPARYVIRYSPRYEEFDGKYHKLRVILNTKGKGKYQVKVIPKGYHATAKMVPCKDVIGRSAIPRPKYIENTPNMALGDNPKKGRHTDEQSDPFPDVQRPARSGNRVLYRNVPRL